MVDAPLPNTLGGRRLLLSGPGGRVSSFDATLLGNSALARKLQAGADANAKLPDGAVAVHVHEEATFDALQTVACCDGMPRESLVACATVILDTLFTCRRAFCVRMRVRGVRRARLTSAWTRRRSTCRARFART